MSELDLHFVVPRIRHAAGGVSALYGFAEAMARRQHRVSVHHVLPSLLFDNDPSDDAAIGEKPAWYVFDETLDLTFRDARTPEDVAARGGVIFYPVSVDNRPDLFPVSLVQGVDIVGEALERQIFNSPCPKVCLASWLTDELERRGVARNELHYVPYGLDTTKFRVSTPIAARTPHVLYCHAEHPMKDAATALRAFELVRERHSGARFSAFTAMAPTRPLPPWLDLHLDPDQLCLHRDLYNSATIFVQSSRREGFGYPAVEAMACGAALVTTDCGGSRDYADHDRTALVVEPGDAESLAEAISQLLNDEERRVALARSGHDFVHQTFAWDRSAAALEAFCMRYLEDPVAFGRLEGVR